MKKYQVIIPADIIPYPEKHEMTAAALLTSHFKTDIKFVVRSNHKTADFFITDTYWELKSPTGKGKRNIQRNLQAALTQSQNIIFDARRSKMNQNKIVHELQAQFLITRKIKRLILITKTGKIVEFNR
jgi:hypothetical protein